MYIYEFRVYKDSAIVREGLVSCRLGFRVRDSLGVKLKVGIG